MNTLSHLDSEGRVRMVDVGNKPVTRRTATASGRFNSTAEVLAAVRGDSGPKADILATARIAGIAAAKKTSELIPLCHQVPLNTVSVDFALADDHIVITATAVTSGQTGVEMEALTAVAIAGLTLHDMVKAMDAGATLGEIRLDTKTGGVRGRWPQHPVRPKTAAVIVSSTRGASGERDDTTGPVIADWLTERGYRVADPTVVADADIAEAIDAAVAESPAVVLTTGGTGPSPSDRTPEASRRVIDRELPGVAEAIRARGLAATPLAGLSRGIAGIAGHTVLINLPGSPGGVRDGLGVLDEVLEHLLLQVAGGGNHVEK